MDGLLDPVTVGSGDDTGPSLAERLMSTPNQYIAGGNEGLAQFKKGFLKFKTEVILTHPDHFRTLAASQSPKVMVIACCDSRVDPTLLMGAGPGDIFTVRCERRGERRGGHGRLALTSDPCCHRTGTLRTWCPPLSGRAPSTGRARRWSMRCVR